jgi:hypothetical protein
LSVAGILYYFEKDGELYEEKAQVQGYIAAFNGYIPAFTRR